MREADLINLSPKSVFEFFFNFFQLLLIGQQVHVSENAHNPWHAMHLANI